MNPLGQFLFNLFFNSTFSFLAGLGVVWLVIRLFRINESSWKLFLYSLPFLKIIFDLGFRGIPSSSIVYSDINPLDLPPHSQTLTLGAGFSRFGPILNVIFSANVPNDKTYSVSAADYLFALSSRYLGGPVPIALLIGTISISCFLLLRRFFHLIQFEVKRRRFRKTDESLQAISERWRTVDVYRSEHFHGTPFTGGWIRPYICFPKTAESLLNAEEKQAVLLHELGHIRKWDLFGTLFVQILGDLFWFVPGYRKLSKKLDNLREILADDFAVRLGAHPAQLASALLKLQSSNQLNPQPVLYSALIRESSLFTTRVKRLLGQGPQVMPRFGWNRKWVRFCVTAWTTGAVTLATFGGNHDVSVTSASGWKNLLPAAWVEVLEAGEFR